MQKGFMPILFLVGIFVAVLFVGEIAYLQNLNSSKKIIQPAVLSLDNKNLSDIQTYTTPQFEFKYLSKDFTVRQDYEEEFNKRGGGDFRKNFKGYVGYEPGKFLEAVVVLGTDGNFDTNLFTLWVFDNPDNITIDSWFDKYWYYPFLWGVFDYTSKGHVTLDQEATVSGRLARYKVVSYQPGSPKYVYISNNGKMYLFRIIGESGEKILATFKFLP